MDASFKQIDYNKLRFFLEVANNHSISKAAKKVARSQSAVSQSIQKLEEELGVQLIEVIEKKVCLTPQGKQIYSFLLENLNPLEEKILSQLNQPKRVEGLLRLGFLQDFSTSFDISRMVVNFQMLYPKVKFEISFGTSKSTEEDLFNNTIDFGFLINFKYSQHLKKIPIMQEKHFLCAHKDLIKKRKGFKKIEEVFEENLIDLTPSFITLKPWFEKFYPKLKRKLSGLSPNLALPNFILNKDLMLQKCGLGILPEKILDLNPELKTIPANKTKFLTVGLDLAYRKTKRLSFLEKTFLENFDKKDHTFTTPT